MKSKSKISKKLKTAVLARDNARCQYPTLKGICGSTEDLCIHDITHTGEHRSIHDCTTLCMPHHNRVTAAHTYATRRMRDLKQQMKQYGTTQALLFPA